MAAQRLGNEGVIRQLPAALQALMTFERFHLHNTPLFQNSFRDPQFDPRYFRQNSGAFPLPCYRSRSSTASADRSR